MTTRPPKLAPLPRPETAEGSKRRVGVEIELGGLDESRVAEVLAAECGGTVGEAEGKGLVVRGSDLGDVEVYLDSRWLSRPETKFDQNLHQLARTVVPVEIVTGPILPGQIEALDAVLARLREAGATGTTSGLLAGYGVHFNPEVVSTARDDVLPVLSAFAFCEDALRHEMQIDMARRVLPFVAPYPRALLDALAQTPPRDTGALIDLYVARAPSRNHGLDMLSLFVHVDRPRVEKAIDLVGISGRPTFHYRLPDTRLDDDDWSLALEWNRWVRIERLAEDRGLVAELAREWRAHRAALTTTRADWTRRVAAKVGSFA